MPLKPPPFAAPPAPTLQEESTPETRRRWWRRDRAAVAVPDPGVMDLPTPQGYVARRSGRKARRGWYARWPPRL